MQDGYLGRGSLPCPNLTPVPEPATAMLVASAIFRLGTFRQRTRI
jgi:hypothetical protein